MPLQKIFFRYWRGFPENFALFLKNITTFFLVVCKSSCIFTSETTKQTL